MDIINIQTHDLVYTENSNLQYQASPTHQKAVFWQYSGKKKEIFGLVSHPNQEMRLKSNLTRVICHIGDVYKPTSSNNAALLCYWSRFCSVYISV